MYMRHFLANRSAPPASLQEMNRLLNGFLSDSPQPRSAYMTPSMDIYETESDFKLAIEIPGLDIKDIDITLEENQLTIKGEKKADSVDAKHDYYHRERRFGQFQRVITLPETADGEKAEAAVAKGVLTVSIPKKVNAKPQPRKLDIKTAN